MAKKTYETTTDVNADPITGEPGSHPVGTGLGAAGAGVAGAAVGAVLGGPVGGLLGGVLGAVAGGAAGHAVAEHVDPTGEDLYWKDNYKGREYVRDEPYETYRPAYAYGWTARRYNLDRSWDDVEPELQRQWEDSKDDVGLAWDRARYAAKDAWHHVDESFGDWFGEEDDYWRANYRTREYVGADDDYEDLRPAYRYGWESRLRSDDRRWEDVESDLERGWRKSKRQAQLGWDRAKHAARDAWHRVERRLPGDFDRDGR